MSLGFAILACIAFHHVASAVDVQRMDSPWSFYSLGLLAETSCVCRPVSCVPDLLVPTLYRVHRIARSIRPVPPVVVAPTPAPASVSEKAETPHRGSRGGKRQHRRCHAQDLCQAQIDVAPPAALPSPTIPAAVSSLTWDAATDSESHPQTFTSDGSGRVISIADGRDKYFIDPPKVLKTSAARDKPDPRSKPTHLPASRVPPTPPKTVIRRPYPHRDAAPIPPAITTIRRTPSLEQTLETVTVRVLPAGKLNQRARRALAARTSLDNFLHAP
ncbi:hypothetical protein BV20DRAFT_19334 [Pilatotrama ljubarskyi]|nr:hypothetical protein BV20DRAFT_19334 [Pilatotrama ljubarskyi]